MATANQCAANGMGFDASTSYCYLDDKTGARQWFDGDPLAAVTAPLVNTPGNPTVNAPWVRPLKDTAPPPMSNVPAPSFFDGVTTFLTAPSLFGLPTWVLLAAAAGGFYILTQMDGGTKKKGGGLFG